MARPDPTGEQPIEESPQVAAAIDDETAVPRLVDDGGPDEQIREDQTPEFTQPGEVRPDPSGTDELIGDAYGAGSPGGDARTGAEQPWDAEDLAAAKGQDPSPENAARARRELDADGAAAVERTVP